MPFPLCPFKLALCLEAHESAAKHWADAYGGDCLRLNMAAVTSHPLTHTQPSDLLISINLPHSLLSSNLLHYINPPQPCPISSIQFNLIITANVISLWVITLLLTLPTIFRCVLTHLLCVCIDLTL